METGGNPWKVNTQKGERTATPSSFLLHLDLKPNNVFLGEIPAQDASSDEMNAIYPQVRIGDFGLADLTNSGARRNPQLWTIFAHLKPVASVLNGADH